MFSTGRKSPKESKTVTSASGLGQRSSANVLQNTLQIQPSTRAVSGASNNAYILPVFRNPFEIQPCGSGVSGALVEGSVDESFHEPLPEDPGDSNDGDGEESDEDDTEQRSTSREEKKNQIMMTAMFCGLTEELNPDVAKKLNQLRMKVSKQKNRVNYSEARLLMFLYARDLDVTQAFKLLKSYTRFYRKCGCPDKNGVPGYKFLSIDKVAVSLETEVLCLPRAFDKDGFYIVYMKPREYWPGKQDLDTLLLSAMYLIERVMEAPEIQKKGVTFMADMSGWTKKNFTVTYAYRWFFMMQFAWPIALRSFLMVDTPSWFGDIWKVIRPMMAKAFADKWKFTTRDNIDLLIDRKYLPADLGGDNFEDSFAFITERYKIEEKSQSFHGLEPGVVLSSSRRNPP